MADKHKVHPEKEDKKKTLAFNWVILVVSIIVLVGGFIWLLV